MRYRKLDEAGDYVFGKGGRDFLINSPDAVAQAINTRLRLWYGEWFLDRFDGMPWLQQVLGKHSNRLRDAAIRRRVLTTQGVRAMLSFLTQYNAETREFSVQMIVETDYGILTLSGGTSAPGEYGAISLKVR